MLSLIPGSTNTDTLGWPPTQSVSIGQPGNETQQSAMLHITPLRATLFM